jgi:large subunit ribosomal protein L10
MGSARKIKEEKVARFQGYADKAKALVVADYKGLTVYAMEDLRRKVREIGGNVVVIKNTLAAVALKGIGITDIEKDLEGQIAFVFSIEDAVGATKLAQQFAKDNKAFNIVAGYFDGKRLSIEEVGQLASMASKEELRSRFVGILIAPMAEFIGTLTAPLQELIGTLEAKGAKMENEPAMS